MPPSYQKFCICAHYMPGENKAILVLLWLHIVSYKIKTNVGIYTKFFPACLKHLVSMSEIMFSSDSMSKNIVQQLKIHECLLSFSTLLFWNGWKTMVQKCENDRYFPHLSFLIPINIYCHPHTSHFRLPK